MPPAQTPAPQPAKSDKPIATAADDQKTNRMPLAEGETELNRAWAKTIAIADLVTLAAGASLLILLDLPIALGSPDLWPFFYIMLVSFGFFCLFFLLDRYWIKRFRYSASNPVDSGMAAYVICRNVWVIILVVPGFQLIGLLISPFVGITFMVLQFVLPSQKLRSLKKGLQ